MPRRRLAIALAVAVLVPAAAGAAPAARFFLLERTPQGVALRADSLAPGTTAEYVAAPDTGLIDLVLPAGPGRMASLLRPSDRGTLVVGHRDGVLRAVFRGPDGSARERAARSLAELAREETRLNVTGGDGTRAAFVIRGGVAVPDTGGPVANLLAGRLPFQLVAGDWVVQTETWRRPLAAPPRGRMTLARGPYLTAEAVRPDGVRGRFILDLGAGESVVSPGFVPAAQAVARSSRLEYALRSEQLLEYRAGGGAGIAPVLEGRTVFPSLLVGGVAVDSLDAQVAELPAGLGGDVVGILGIDVLRRAARVRLTVPAKPDAPAVLEFDPPRPLAREAGRCGFSWVSSHAVLPGAIAGRAALWIADSGAPASYVDAGAVAGEPWVLAAGDAGRPAAPSSAVAPSLRVGSGPAWTGAPVRLANLPPFEALRGDGRVPAALGVPELARLGSFELDFAARVARWGPARR